MGVGVATAACATGDGRGDNAGAALTETRPTVTSVEVAELEISGIGVDRFVSCPPPGDLGQAWLPPIPEWSPAPPAASDGEDRRLAQAGDKGGPGQTELTSAQLEVAAGTRAPTEQAIKETYPDFRRCYHQGRAFDPTQDGHVAIVARVGADGKVAKVEAYGGCNISSEVLECMQSSVKKLRFEPPGSAGMTVTIPALFASTDGYHRARPAMNDAYTASAYVTMEEARPALHTCESMARRAGQGIEASATFAIAVDGRGKVVSAHIDPWTGSQELLRCAAAAIQSMTFAPPPHGKGSILARIVFNPRAGTR
jgi:hypothetical protein